MRKSLIEHLNLPTQKQVRLTGLNGQADVVDVIRLYLRPVTDSSTGLINIAPAVRVWMAVVPDLNEAVILTPNVVSLLRDTALYNVLAVKQDDAAQASSEREASTAITTLTDSNEKGDSLISRPSVKDTLNPVDAND